MTNVTPTKWYKLIVITQRFITTLLVSLFSKKYLLL